MKDARREILERLYEVAYDHGYCKIIQQIEDTANVTLAELDKLEGKEYWTKGGQH